MTNSTQKIFGFPFWATALIFWTQLTNISNDQNVSTWTRISTKIKNRYTRTPSTLHRAISARFLWMGTWLSPWAEKHHSNRVLRSFIPIERAEEIEKKKKLLPLQHNAPSCSQTSNPHSNALATYMQQYFHCLSSLCVCFFCCTAYWENTRLLLLLMLFLLLLLLVSSVVLHCAIHTYTRAPFVLYEKRLNDASHTVVSIVRLCRHFEFNLKHRELN